MSYLNDVFQVLAFIGNVLTIWLITKGNLFRGSLVGLLCQAFWIGLAITSGQWAILLLSFWYAWCYGKVVYKHYKIKERLWNLLQFLLSQ